MGGSASVGEGETGRMSEIALICQGALEKWLSIPRTGINCSHKEIVLSKRFYSSSCSLL